MSYKWRIRRPLPDGEWRGDLTDEFEQPRNTWEYSFALPYKGRFWAFSRDNMKKMERAGRIEYTRSGMPNYRRFLDEMPGVPLQNDWQDIKPAPLSEAIGYPTQKPLALMRRIIETSSNKDDVVLTRFADVAPQFTPPPSLVVSGLESTFRITRFG